MSQPTESRVPDELRERARLEVLAATGLLDSEPEREFDALIEVVKRSFGCGAAAISLVDSDRQWFKAQCGVGVSETPRSYSFCTIAVDADAMLIVPNAALDPRFADNPFVTTGTRTRFYAGVPLRARQSLDAPLLPIGTLCISDSRPRMLTAEEIALLQSLGKVAEALVRPRAMARQTAELVARHHKDLADLTRTHRQFRQAERMANIGSWRLSLPDHVLEWSEQVYAIHGVQVGTMLRVESALDFYPPQSRAVIEAAIERIMEDGTPFDVEVDFITAAGEPRRVRSLGEREMRDGHPIALIGVFQDITMRHEMEQALRRSAMTDDLTRMTNRAGFTDILDARMANAVAQGRPLALALIDLDGFKRVNDRCGHLTGDEVLKHVALRLSQPQWSCCAPARLGGDEFVLLIDCPRDSHAFHDAIDRLLRDLSHTVCGPNGPLPVSGTIGISWLEDGMDRRDLLDRADQALYEAKRLQPGTAKIFGEQGLVRRHDRDRRSDPVLGFCH